MSTTYKRYKVLSETRTRTHFLFQLLMNVQHKKMIAMTMQPVLTLTDHTLAVAMMGLQEMDSLAQVSICI